MQKEASRIPHRVRPALPAGAGRGGDAGLADRARPPATQRPAQDPRLPLRDPGPAPAVLMGAG